MVDNFKCICSYLRREISKLSPTMVPNLSKIMLAIIAHLPTLAHHTVLILSNFTVFNFFKGGAYGGQFEMHL